MFKDRGRDYQGTYTKEIFSYLFQYIYSVVLFNRSQCHLVHVPEWEVHVLQLAGHLQLFLHVAQEERAVDLCHLEEEGEDVEKRSPREEVGEVLDLLLGGVDASLLCECVCGVNACIFTPMGSRCN